MTAIEWTDATWNPTTGCDRVSPGCDHCYALGMAKRLKAMGQPKYQADGDPRTSGPGFGLTMHPDVLDLPLRWRKPRRVFVNSMSDLFHPKVDDIFIAQVWAVMSLTPQHTYQILTKRPKRMRSLLNSHLFPWVVGRKRIGFGANDYTPAPHPLPNVWLGVSVEDQRRADERIPALLDTPAAVRFLSCEPLLGPVDLEVAAVCGDRRCTCPPLHGLGWVIVGGESGPGARPMHPAWARTIRDQCQTAGVPFFFKQWGEYVPAAVHDDPDFAGGRSFEHPQGGRIAVAIRRRGPSGTFRGGAMEALAPGDRTRRLVLLDDDTVAVRVGKHAAGRELDGRTWDEYPAAVTV
jgi:protein gp37